MVDFSRVAVQRQAKIKAPAQDIYALISDWGELARWAPTDTGIVLERVELIEPIDKMPLKRIVHLGGGGKVEEILFHKDPQTLRIYYQALDGSLPGIMGYVATNTVDVIDDETSLFTAASTFDVVDPALGAEGARQMFETIYDGMARGLTKYFAG